MDTGEIIIDEMRDEDVCEACALWYSIPEVGVARSFDTPAFRFTHEKNLVAQAFWRGTGWEHCPWVQYQYREFDTER